MLAHLCPFVELYIVLLKQKRDIRFCSQSGLPMIKAEKIRLNSVGLTLYVSGERKYL